MLAPRLLVGVFTQDAALAAYSIPLMRIYLAALLLMGVLNSCQQTFIAIGNAKTSLFIALLRKCILLIPLIFLLPAMMVDKVSAVFLAEPIADALSVTVAAVLFYFQFRDALRRLAQQP